MKGKKVSEKKIYKVLDELGIDRDCGGVKRAMGKLFPESKPVTWVIAPDRIGVTVGDQGGGKFDIRLIVDGERIGVLSGGTFASCGGFRVEHMDIGNHGGYIKVIKI